MLEKYFKNFPLFLAPMVGVTDFAFRSIAKDCGADFTCTEMVSAKALIYDSKKTKNLLYTCENEIPKVVQIFGNEPNDFEKVTKSYLNDFDFIDINFGCPAPKIFNNNQGSALLADPFQIFRIVQAVKNNTEKFVSAKIRIGIFKGEYVGVQIAKVIEDAGADMIVVHGRTKQDGYSGSVNLEEIAKIKASVKIKVIGNGDVKDQESLAKMKSTGVDGAMIGRGALGEPEIFAKLKGLPVPSKFEIIQKHINLLRTRFDDDFLTKYLRKHLLWYLKGKKSNDLKLKICLLQNIDFIVEELKNYFEQT